MEFDISNKAVTAFLDAVDIVLNSNTFLLHYTTEINNNIEDVVTSFIKSDTCYQQILMQDIDRKWLMFHRFNGKANRFDASSKRIVKPAFQATIDKPPVNKLEYLTAMLAGNDQIDHFFSFYNQQMEAGKAAQIVTDFIYYITWGNEWELYTIQPDFLYGGNDMYDIKNVIAYFDGYGNDTATLIVSGSRHYIILTNGMD